jgi:hypothetical protein
MYVRAFFRFDLEKLNLIESAFLKSIAIAGSLNSAPWENWQERRKLYS